MEIKTFGLLNRLLQPCCDLIFVLDKSVVLNTPEMRCSTFLTSPDEKINEPK